MTSSLTPERKRERIRPPPRSTLFPYTTLFRSLLLRSDVAYHLGRKPAVLSSQVEMVSVLKYVPGLATAGLYFTEVELPYAVLWVRQTTELGTTGVVESPTRTWISLLPAVGLLP